MQQMMGFNSIIIYALSYLIDYLLTRNWSCRSEVSGPVWICLQYDD